jgi:hypothetical protein
VNELEGLAHGEVIDVEHILGERSAPKVSERFERFHAQGRIKEPWAP